MMENVGKTLLSGIIIVVVIAVGILLLPTFIQIALIAACIACSVLYFNSYPRWLERAGFGLIQDDRRARDKALQAVERGYAEIISGDDAIHFRFTDNSRVDSEYVISTKFYKKLLDNINQKKVLTEEEWERCCRAAAPDFPLNYASALAVYLSNLDYLLEINYDGPYLSSEVVKDCEQLLNREGAATEIQFADICGKCPFISKLYDQRVELAEAILKNMENNGRAEKMAHTESSGGPKGRYLYVSCEPSADCKMTRREISLD